MLKRFKTLYHFIFKYKLAFVFFFVASTVAVILENLAPYCYKILVNALEQHHFENIFLILALFVGVRLVANLVDVLGRVLGDKVIVPAAIDARVAVFRHIQNLDFAFHVNKNTGSLISAFKRGDGAFFEMFYNIHRSVYSVLLSLIIMLLFFAQITPVIAFMTLGVFVVNSIIGWKMIESNIKKRIAFNEAEDQVSGVITDNLLNYETVKFFAKEKKEEKRLIEEFKDWNKKIWLYANSFRMMDVVVGSISVIGIFFVLFVVLRKLIAGEVSIGDVVLVAGFSTSFFYRFFELLWHVRGIAKHHADLDKYFAVLDNEVLIKDPAQPVAVKEIKGQVEMQDVSFKYPDSQDYVLQNIDLKIPAGSSVAFVGRSGAGKTTIVKLLLRFYDVSAGKIAIDGIDIKDFAKSQLRSFIGIVPQEPILFNNTIGYNIAYGKDDATKEDIVQAAKLANLHDFIDSLPLGYDTEVGERGIKLSGGQKQRLAIARMILADPSIIVFDEATSNLDSESERLIQDALEKVSKGRTVLIIAHRFSTVRRVDKIVVMEQGKVIEAGNHDSLIRKRDGLYSYLWRLQTKQAKVSSEVSLLE
jgi:ABC-type multidrug transport system fused ATPase/permease subunit